MRAFLFICLAVWNVTASAQSVIADPAVGQVVISNIANQNLPAVTPTMPAQVVYILKLPIRNLSTVNAIPTGSAKVKIGLGSKLILNPSFNLATTNTSTYFNWSLFNNDGQYELLGDGFGMVALPANYNDTATFLIKGIILGGSTITANFLVTNHNTTVVLSDDNGTNNNSSQYYIIVQALPVTFTGLYLTKENCGLKVRFTSENEINLSHYEVEYSNDGVRFEKGGDVATNNTRNYTFKLHVPANFTVGNVYVRIKSVDNDGKFQYSEIKMLKDLCDAKANIFLYPNPVTKNQHVLTIANKIGAFVQGKYLISLFDNSGKLLNTTQQSLQNIAEFKYKLIDLAAGNYFLRMETALGDLVPVVLAFQKQN